MANQQAQMANQQAMDAAQRASQQAMDDNQRAAQNAQNNLGTCCYVFAPKASVKGGTYAAPVTVKLKDRTRATAIYYTLDGWTPTTASARYEGPITISSTATLQAIAFDPHNNRSQVLYEAFTISGANSQSAEPRTLVTDFPANYGGAPVLMPGTLLPLEFTAAVSSHGLEVGDRLPVALAQDVRVGGKLLAAKGTPVVAKVTQVDGTGRMGLPGTLSFAVSSITLLDGTVLPLVGQETKEGRPRQGRAILASVVVPGGLFVRGGDAEIPAGATMTAQVVASRTDQRASASPDWLSDPQAKP
jgi:hypothetical protein